MSAALVDASTAAFSAAEYIDAPQDHSAHTVIQSLGLLAFSKLEDTYKRMFVESISQPWGGVHLIYPSYLEYDPATEAVEFSTETRARIENLQEPNSGCPAQGLIMERFYKQYVGLVFSAELTSESSGQILSPTDVL